MLKTPVDILQKSYYQILKLHIKIVVYVNHILVFWNIAKAVMIDGVK